jgi:hypothetical protein
MSEENKTPLYPRAAFQHEDVAVRLESLLRCDGATSLVRGTREVPVKDLFDACHEINFLREGRIVASERVEILRKFVARYRAMLVKWDALRLHEFVGNADAMKALREIEEETREFLHGDKP